MRIAIVHPFTWVDVRRGGERYAHDLTWWLSKHGHEVDYIAGGPAQSITEQSAGSRIVRLHHRHGDRLTGWGFEKSETFGATVLPWLARNRYDVVHAFVPSAAIAARAARQRTVFTALGHAGPDTTSRTRRLLQLADRAAHVTTALSESSAEALTAITGRPPRVVNPGVRTDVFTPDITARTGPPRLLFNSPASTPHKRAADVLAAMPAVLDALPDARLLLGGGGSLPTDLATRVAKAIDVIGAGALTDVPDRYREATVTVLPSEHEAFGLVLVESLACGTPVVAARSGALPEIVPADAHIGALASVGDAGELAEAIIATCRLAADPETPSRCVLHAQRWSWAKVGPDHLAVYELAQKSATEAAGNP